MPNAMWSHCWPKMTRRHGWRGVGKRHLVALAPRIQDSPVRDRDGRSESRLYIHRLVAVAEGTGEIPAVEMSFFDPETESYGVSRGRPFRILVHPAGDGAWPR